MLPESRATFSQRRTRLRKMKNTRIITEELESKIVLKIQSRLAKGMEWNTVKSIIIYENLDVKVYKN